MGQNIFVKDTDGDDIIIWSQTGGKPLVDPSGIQIPTGINLVEV
jgi:hypothetical protein